MPENLEWVKARADFAFCEGCSCDLWRLGAAPFGSARGSFVVFLPEAPQA